MKKYSERNEEAPAWKPTLVEAKDLSEKLKRFTKKEVNGKMQYPFELFLEHEKVVSFDQHGRMQIINPLQYYRLNEINSFREWMEQKDLERVFAQFPEEKEAYEAKRRQWLEQGKTILGHFSTATLDS